MALGIFNIGKANARIAELEKELTEAKTANDAATKAATDNASEIEAEAERLKKENENLKAKVATLETDAKTAAERFSKIEAELKTAQTEVAALPEKVETAASAKAKQILASVGQPPVTSTPAANPAEPKKRDFKAEVKPMTAAERLALERK